MRHDNRSVFILTSYEPREGKDGSLLVLEDNASIALRSSCCGVFSSVSNAEHAIRELVKQRKCEIKDEWSMFPHFGFTLIEHYIDDPWMKCSKDVSYVCEFRSFRTYLGNGKLNYFSDLDDACEKKFIGTSCTSRFKKGSIAWILRRCKAVPTLVEKEAMTKKWWKAHMKKGVAGDFTDDSGIDFPLDVNGHDHTFSPLLFPLSSLDFKIPDEAVAKMKASRDQWMKTGI